jgi:diguanylate cyclase (GGDEF)-like protein
MRMPPPPMRDGQPMPPAPPAAQQPMQPVAPPVATAPPSPTTAVESDAALDALQRARASGDPAQLGQALLEFAQARHADGRNTEAFAAWEQAAQTADRIGDDRLGREAARAAANAYDEIGDRDLAASWRQRAEAYRARIESGLPAVAVVGATPTAPAATDATRTDDHASVAPTVITRVPNWLWLVLGASLVMFWAWRRSHQRAAYLGEEAERLARHKRHLQGAQKELQREADHLRQTATTDALTGALTRVAFATALEPLLLHASRFNQRVALFVFDMDHFKAINDGHGHLVGDEALKLVVGVAREKLDSDDLLGRFGGDEFLVAAKRDDVAEIVGLAEALRQGVRDKVATDPRMGALSLSIGIAMADATSGYAIDGLFAHADSALYQAKREGRNRVVLATAQTPDSPADVPKRSLGAA